MRNQKQAWEAATCVLDTNRRLRHSVSNAADSAVRWGLRLDPGFRGMEAISDPDKNSSVGSFQQEQQERNWKQV